MKFIVAVFILIQWQGSVKAQQTIRVSNVNEFYNAIASNTTIILEHGDYHLEKIDTMLENSNCNWSLVLFDEIYANEQEEKDKTLLISGVENLTIKSSGKGKDSVRILTNRRSASVLAFQGSENIKLEGIIFGHDIVKYKDPNDPWISFCSGEVLEFFDCNRIEIKKSILFGCGTRGFLAHRCKSISIENTVIKECSFGAFGIFSCEDISFEKCEIKNNTYRCLMEIEGCKNMTVKKSLVSYNIISEYNDSVVKLTASENIQLHKFKLKENDFSKEQFYIK